MYINEKRCGDDEHDDGCDDMKGEMRLATADVQDFFWFSLFSLLTTRKATFSLIIIFTTWMMCVYVFVQHRSMSQQRYRTHVRKKKKWLAQQEPKLWRTL